MKEQLEKDSTTDQLTLQVFDHNRLLIPTACTVSIYRDGQALVSDQVATVGADGVVTYTPGTDVTDTLGENLKAEWKPTISGDVKVITALFDVVLRKLFPTVTDEDLVSECAPLREEKFSYYGTAGGGTSLTLIDDSLLDHMDNQFTGGVLEILEGTNAGESRVVAAFDRETFTITVATAFTGAIDTTSKYRVHRTWQREIDRAWEEVNWTLQQLGRRANLILNDQDLKPAHLFRALEKVCRGITTDPDDIWHDRATLYGEKAGTMIAGLRLVYDEDEDGEADSDQPVQLVFRR